MQYDYSTCIDHDHMTCMCHEHTKIMWYEQRTCMYLDLSTCMYYDKKLAVTQNQIQVYEGACSTAITGIIAPLSACVFWRMTNLSMEPPCTPRL